MKVKQKSKRNDKPNCDISQLWLLRKAVMDTNMSPIMYFPMCKKLLGYFDYIVIILFPILNPKLDLSCVERNDD